MQKYIPNKAYQFEKKEHRDIAQALYDNNWFRYHVELQKNLVRFELITKRDSIQEALDTLPEFFIELSKAEAFNQAKHAVEHYIPNFDFFNIVCLDDLKYKLNAETSDDKQNKVRSNLVTAINVYFKSKENKSLIP